MPIIPYKNVFVHDNPTGDGGIALNTSLVNLADGLEGKQPLLYGEIGNVVYYNEDNAATDSGIPLNALAYSSDLTNLIPRLTDFTEGNVPKIDEEGRLVDSGIVAGSIATQYYVGQSIGSAIGSAVSSLVPSSRQIATTAPLQGGGGLSNNLTLSLLPIGNANVATGAGIDVAKLGTGTVSDAVFGYLTGVTSSIQTQINGKATTGADVTFGNVYAAGSLSIGDTLHAPYLYSDYIEVGDLYAYNSVYTDGTINSASSYTGDAYVNQLFVNNSHQGLIAQSMGGNMRFIPGVSGVRTFGLEFNVTGGALDINPTDYSKAVRFYGASGVANSSIVMRTATQIGGEHAAANIPLIIRGVSGQTGNLISAINSAGTTVASVNPAGGVMATSGVIRGTASGTTTQELLRIENSGGTAIVRSGVAAGYAYLHSDVGGPLWFNSGIGVSNNVGLSNLNSGGAFRFINSNDNVGISNNLDQTFVTFAATSTLIGASSGVKDLVSITPIITQTSSAGYIALKVNPTHTTVGSGNKYLFWAGYSNSAKFVVDHYGNATAYGSVSAVSYISSPYIYSSALNLSGGGIAMDDGGSAFLQIDLSGGDILYAQNSDGDFAYGISYDGTTHQSGDIELNNIGNGVIIKSPNGTRWRMTVSNAGTAVFTSL